MENIKKNPPKQSKAILLDDDLLDYLSYGIRTPVNTILGYLDLIEHQDISKETLKDCIIKLKGSSHDLLNLTNDLITEVSDEFNNVKRTLDKENIQIRTNVKGNFIVKADEKNIKEVLEKIVDNAIQHTKVGYIEIGYEIIDSQDDSSKAKVEFYVKDTGSGISDTRKEIIFDRNKLINSTELKNYGGTGLGLAISKGLVEMMDGNIHVDSAHESGSTFYFTIPIIPIKTSKDIRKNPLHLTHKNYDWDNKTILIAEDIDSNYKVIEVALRNTNSKLIWAKDGLEVIDKCKSNKVDFIIMDIRLPKLNGFEATTKIKEIFPEMPIIVLTACLYTDELKKSFEAGCNDYLVKPVEHSLLRKTIDKYI